MKTNYLKLMGSVFLALTLCIGFTSCKDDDDSLEGSIIGKWKFVHAKGFETIPEDQYSNSWDTWSTNDREEIGSIVEFFSDGRISYYYLDGTLYEEQTWKIKGKNLEITTIYEEDGETDDVTVLEIKELTDEKLVVFLSETEEDGYHYEETQTFQRVK